MVTPDVAEVVGLQPSCRWDLRTYISSLMVLATPIRMPPIRTGPQELRRSKLILSKSLPMILAVGHMVLWSMLGVCVYPDINSTCLSYQ